jgi:hypothetical protein
MAVPSLPSFSNLNPQTMNPQTVATTMQQIAKSGFQPNADPIHEGATEYTFKQPSGEEDTFEKTTGNSPNTTRYAFSKSFPADASGVSHGQSISYQTDATGQNTETERSTFAGGNGSSHAEESFSRTKDGQFEAEGTNYSTTEGGVRTEEHTGTDQTGHTTSFTRTSYGDRMLQRMQSDPPGSRINVQDDFIRQ